MSAKTEEDTHSPQDGRSGVPFDPADYARHEAEPSPESDSGDEDSSAPGPRWLQLIKNHWLNAVGGILFLLLVANSLISDNADQWAFFFCLYLLTEMFFSKSRVASGISCLLMLWILLLFISPGLLSWGRSRGDFRNTIPILTAGLFFIQMFERSAALKLVNLLFLGFFIVLSVVILVFFV